MVFPRLLGLALGWSPRDAHDLKDYLQRLSTHGPRLEAAGLRFFPAPQVHWER